MITDTDVSSLYSVEFLPCSTQEAGPLAAFGGTDGIIRVLSVSSLQVGGSYQICGWTLCAQHRDIELLLKPVDVKSKLLRQPHHLLCSWSEDTREATKGQ